MELPLTTPSPDHVEFDQMCAEVDDFQPLPTTGPDADEEGEAETSLNGQILAGLVLPC